VTYLAALAALVLPASAAGAQAEASACELHVWPTPHLYAVFHGATARSILQRNPAGEVLPRQNTQQMLIETAGGNFQSEAIDELRLDGAGRFAGHQVIFHPAPAESRFANWIDRNIGAGTRESASTAQCYSELHVVFITHFKTALSKRIQTAFVFREFGPSGPATGWAVDAASNSAPSFPSGSAAEDEQARLDLRRAFQQNLRDFLGSRAMRRLRRPR